MPYLTHPIGARAPFVRTVAIAALMGATFLATPLTAHAILLIFQALDAAG